MESSIQQHAGEETDAGLCARSLLSSPSLEPRPDPPQQHQRDSSKYAAVMLQMQAYGRCPAVDPDADSMVAKLDQHMQALTQDAVEHLLAVKARMLQSLKAAVVNEQTEGEGRLAAKQAEVDILKSHLQDTQGQLSKTEVHLERVSTGYALKHEEVLDTRALLRAWFVWRAHIARQRRLAKQALQAHHFYMQRWLLGRAWDRWAGRARSRYRQLVVQRAEQQREADAAALGATHSQEVAALRANIDALQQQLQQEAEARNRMEEEMKRAFMRGVTAINLEAVQIMRRGAPPSGANPFPVTLPLNASTAAAGLAAMQQQHQHLAQQQQQQVLQAYEQDDNDDVGLGEPAAAVPAAAGVSRNPGPPSCCPGPWDQVEAAAASAEVAAGGSTTFCGSLHSSTAAAGAAAGFNPAAVSPAHISNGLATWHTVQSPARSIAAAPAPAASSSGTGTDVSLRALNLHHPVMVGAVRAATAPAAAAGGQVPAGWGGATGSSGSSSSSAFAVSQAQGASLPKVCVEWGPAACGQRGAAAAAAAGQTAASQQHASQTAGVRLGPGGGQRAAQGCPSSSKPHRR